MFFRSIESAGGEGDRRARNDRLDAVSGIRGARRAATARGDAPGHAAQARADLARAAGGRAVIPERFEYVAPQSLAEAVDRVAKTAGAKLLGGGMSLIPALKHRLAAASLLVDLGQVPDLEGVSEKRGRIAIGGRTTPAPPAPA